MHQSLRMQTIDAGQLHLPLPTAHIPDRTVHQKAAKGTTVTNGGQGTTEMMALLVLTKDSIAPRQFMEKGTVGMIPITKWNLRVQGLITQYQEAQV